MHTPSPRRKLPVQPSLEHLQKQAKRLTKLQPMLRLAEAQHQLAQEYGCRNWAELAHVVETMARGADQRENVSKEVEPLPQAARSRDIGAVKRLLSEGRYTPHDLDLALGNAVCYGSPSTWELRRSIADLLLDSGADADGQFGSAYGPIVFATGECIQPEGLRYLIEAGADVSFPPISTKYGQQCPLSHILGTYGRGANARKHEYIDLLLKHGAYVPPEVTPPVLAIHRGDASMLGELLDREPALLTRRFADMPYGNMDLRGATLLHCAVEFGENECADELLRRGASINLPADLVEGTGGQTPIFHAIATIEDGNFRTLDYLVRRMGRAIDLHVRATWRLFQVPQPTPMTPLEFAEYAASRSSEHGRSKAGKEIALLHTLAGAQS